MQKVYKISILYFLLFSLLLFISSILIFNEKIGFSYNEVLEYYLGSEKTFVTAKTYAGTLKLILPHIMAFGLFIMVTLHFLIFTKKKRPTLYKLIIYMTFLSGFFELFSPFIIISGVEFFAYIKIISFVLFELLMLYTFWLLFKSIIYE